MAGCVEDQDLQMHPVPFILAHMYQILGTVVELNDETIIAILKFRHVRYDSLAISFEFPHPL